MPDIESGMFIGSTSVNGAVSIKWGRHSTAPFAAFVTYAPNNNDSVTNNFTPLIWSVGDSDFQVRLRDDRSHAWGGAQPVRLYWLATWKPIAFPNPAFYDVASTLQQRQRFAYAHR